MSHLNTSVVTSTCEAEYIALFSAVTRATHIVQLLEFFNVKQSCIDIGVDSENAISLANNPMVKTATKHLDVKYHYTRQQIAKGVAAIFYIRTQFQLADILTKNLPVTQFNKLKEIIIGLRSLTEFMNQAELEDALRRADQSKHLIKPDQSSFVRGEVLDIML